MFFLVFIALKVELFFEWGEIYLSVFNNKCSKLNFEELED
jgi:hypothetical protein